MTSRITWLDRAKGIGILLVVIGHTVAPSSITANTIFSFHMPLFFILSGYLFNFSKYEKNISLLFKNRIKSLLYPYFVSGFIFFIIFLLFQCPNPIVDTPLSNILAILWQIIESSLYGVGAINIYTPLSNIAPVGPAWFVVSLFCAEFLLLFFLKLTLNFNSVISFFFVLCISAAGVLIGKIIFLPWSFDISMVGLLFLYVGYLMKQYNILERINKQILFITLLLLWLICLKFSFLSMNNRDYQHFFLSFIGAIAASVILMYLVNKFLNTDNYISNFISYLGSQSLIILLFHNMMFVYLSQTSIIRYHWSSETLYLIFSSLAIGNIIKATPFINKFFFSNSKLNREI